MALNLTLNFVCPLSGAHQCCLAWAKISPGYSSSDWAAGTTVSHGHTWAMTMLILLLRTTGAGAEKGSLSWKHLGTYFLQVCCVSSAEPHPLSSPTLLCPCWGSLCLDLDLPDPDQGSTPWLDLDFPHHHKTCILFPSVLFENQNRHKFHTNVFSGKI